jgi:ribosome-binding factor A
MRPHDHQRERDHGADRAASALRRALQLTLSEGLSDPRMDDAVLTVTGAGLSPDGQALRVGVSVLPADAGPRVLGALRHAAGHLKAGMARHVEIRRMPRLEFELDDSIKRQAALEAGLAGDRTPEGTS